MVKLLGIATLAAFALPVLAGEWKMRAREHYEIHKVETDTQNETFKGFSNTINLWYEEPMKYSLGLAAGPLLGSARPDEGKETITLGSKVRLVTAGVEFKYFPLSALEGLFFRVGAGWAQLQTNGTVGDKAGYQGYTGLGYEFWVSQRFTIAVEGAYRHSELEDDIKVKTTTPSIGFHFYKDI